VRGGSLAQGVEAVAMGLPRRARLRFTRVEVRKTGLLMVGAGCISNTQVRRRSLPAPWLWLRLKGQGRQRIIAQQPACYNFKGSACLGTRYDMWV
jgi:hypothetical protein